MECIDSNAFRTNRHDLSEFLLFRSEFDCIFVYQLGAVLFGDTARAAYPDLDASPTKAWMIHHRTEEYVRPMYSLGFGKRPYEELYDLSNDPDYMNNVAGQDKYAGVKKELYNKLMKILCEQNDPRVVEKPCRYESQPYAGPLQPFQIPNYQLF